MPLQNRVSPEGTIVATPHRGTMMGNRGGAFHCPDRTLSARHWHSRQWICCVLDFKGRRRQVMQPGRYTELFFLDEATALAAGHRPCFECRRAQALEFARLWNDLRGRDGRATAADMDRQLHAERLDPTGAQRRHLAHLDELPDHVMIRHQGGIARIAGISLQSWSFAGYGPRQPRPADGLVEVLTPPTIVAVLGAGYQPVLHKSAAS